MRIAVIALSGLLALGACTPTQDTNNALIGAGLGAVAADLTGNNVVAGAALGGLAGATCNDVGICR